MKKSLKFLSALLLAVLSFSFASYAQSDENRDENGKVVRGPYEKTASDANWFLSVGGGLNWTADGILSGKVNNGFGPSIDVTFGKWFIPDLGIRIGYQGIKGVIKGTAAGAEFNTKYPLNYIHADLLWNFSNTVCGYRSSRIYSAIPYGHIGLLAAGNRGIAAGAGLLSNFRVAEHWAVFADIRGILAKGENFTAEMDGIAGNLALTAGVTWNMSTTGWTRVSSGTAASGSEAKESLKAAEQAIEEIAAEAPATTSAEETTEANATPAAEAEVASASFDKKPGTFYFGENESWVTLEEAARVKEFVSNANRNTKYLILGFADKNKGDQKPQTDLAYKRALNIGFLLIKYGIPAGNVRSEAGGLISSENEAENRVVIIKKQQ